MITPTTTAPIKSTAQYSSTDSATSPSSEFASFVLAITRVAYLQAQLAANEIAAARIALKSGWIDADTALAMLNETGLLPLIEASS